HRRTERNLGIAPRVQRARAALAGERGAGHRRARAHHHCAAQRTRRRQERGGAAAGSEARQGRVRLAQAHCAAMSALEATGLAKSYKSRQVVRDLSLELARGEVVGLLGPNGAGKTTAFYMIVGLVPCDAGRIRIDDTDVTLLPMHRRVLLDGPFAGVDPLSVLAIQRIIRELTSRGIGVLITDHNVRETLGVCARAYIVNQGSVIASGSAEEVLANPQVREVYLGESFRM